MNRYKDLKPLELAKGSQHEYENVYIIKFKYFHMWLDLQGSYMC